MSIYQTDINELVCVFFTKLQQSIGSGGERPVLLRPGSGRGRLRLRSPG